MTPLVDTHCHLLAGLDDGPRNWDEAVTMCRMAWHDGTRAIAATAHQSIRWPDVTPRRILETTRDLQERLDAARIPLAVYPTAEVMIGPELEADFSAKQLLSIADQGRYLLIELPTGIFFDLRDMVTNLMSLGVRPILAHPERHPEFLYHDGVAEDLILRGCLMQVSAASITQDCYPQMTAALRGWARRNIIQLIGSDGHSPSHRPPGISAAYQRLAEWVGWATADRICSANGMAVLEGLTIETPRPSARKRRWFA